MKNKLSIVVKTISILFVFALGVVSIIGSGGGGSGHGTTTTTTTTLPGGTSAINQDNIGEITNGINAFVSLGDNINTPEDLLTPVCEAGDVTTEGIINNPPAVGETITLTYNDCQALGVITNGTTTITVTEVSGDISGDPPHSLTIHLVYNDLTTEGVGLGLVSTSSADMYISLSEDGTGNFSIIMQGDLTEQSEGEVVTFSDFLMELTYNQNTFAHSLNLIGDLDSTLIGGTVSFTTITPFASDGSSENPTVGELHVTNSIDTSRARITALPDGLSLKIEVDADGDGVYEYVDLINWSDL